MSAIHDKSVQHTFGELGWSEDFVQDLIANDPGILGLGELQLHERERRQPSGGRLDLLLQRPGPNENLRFAVEVQIRATDPDHILRTIEYWDIERRRFPQYDYRAVIVASEITSRYFNVISLFNQYIPVIAVKMTPVSIGGANTIVFTKVLDYSPPGNEEEDAPTKQVSRDDWEKYTSKDTMSAFDSVMIAAKKVSPTIQSKFTQNYIQMKVGASFFKLLTLWPKKHVLEMELPIKQSAEVENKLETAGIQFMGYDETRQRYVLLLGAENAQRNIDLLTKLIEKVFNKEKANGN